MTDDQKRAEVSALYKSPRWKKRVRDMTDAQVFAIWKNQQKRREAVKKQPPPQDDLPF
jgi:hypothetical protein